MDVRISGDGVQVTESFEEYTQKKVAKLSRYLPNINSIRVDMAQQHTKRGPNIMVVQITLRHSRGALLRAEADVEIEDHDAAKIALNEAIDKMYSRIRRFKGKKRSKNRRIAEKYTTTPEELTVAEAMPEGIPNGAATEAEIESEIIRRKVVAVAPMDEDEAVEQMELLGHDFFMFYNMQEDQVNVVYRRKQGGYGVLQPEVG